MNEESTGSTGNETTQDERLWGKLCHLSAFAGYLIPFGNIIGPLVIWLIKKDESQYVDKHGKSSLNFEISITIYILISILLIFIIIGIPILIGIGVYHIIVVVIASVRAFEGQLYDYPLTMIFVR
jgi:uncharacterized Tic20 family protein